MNVDDYLATLEKDQSRAPADLKQRIQAIPDRPSWWQKLVVPSWQTALAYALPLLLGFVFGASPWQDEQSYPLESLVFEQDSYIGEDLQEFLDDA